MPSTRQQRRQRSSLPTYGRRCPTCGHRTSSRRLERQTDLIPVQRDRRWGRYINVRQLRLFIEIAREQVDWESAWINVEILEQIIAHISQMPDDTEMDLDTSPSMINQVIHQLENLGLIDN
ncbi:hypothetical protein FRC09_017418 [Ceratobasidium sp. 395]|nr:hypothetical protein FRC09_017418 [Ceratobasidium sp. 395]